MTDTTIQQLLAEALATIDEEYARLVKDPRTRIELYPVSFLNHYRIYYVFHSGPYHPVAFFIGWALEAPVYLLTAEPLNFIRLAQADGVMIETPQKAIEYGTAYLETTRKMSTLFYLLRAADEAKFLPEATSAEAEQISTFLTNYRPMIKPPQVRRVNDRFVVTIFAIRQQSLERLLLTIDQMGEVQVDINIMEKTLPVVYGS